MTGLKDGLGPGTGTDTAKQEITEDIIITGSNRIYFRDAGISLYSNADGKFTIESDGSGDDDIIITGNTKITGDVEVNLAGTDGTNQFQIKDSDTFPTHKFDSAGNVKLKGKQERI